MKYTSIVRALRFKTFLDNDIFDLFFEPIHSKENEYYQMKPIKKQIDNSNVDLLT